MTDINKTLDCRKSTYGPYAKKAKMAQALKEQMRTSANWHGLSPDKKEALDMIQHKIARILNGNSEYDDNWHDIAGYSTLVERELRQKTTIAKKPATAMQEATHKDGAVFYKKGPGEYAMFLNGDVWAESVYVTNGELNFFDRT